MPPSSTSGELSLRHLPDVSDTSFSFQIPGAAQEYNLIAEDDLDFFSGANVSTPLSPPANVAPLTLRDLTPRPAIEKRPFKDSRGVPLPSEKVFHTHNPKEETRTTRIQQPELSKVPTKVMSNLGPITSSSLARPLPADAAPPVERMIMLKKDIDTLTADLRVPSSPNNQEPIVIDNQRPEGIRRASLEKKLPPSRSERRKKLVPRSKQTVIEGGIAKSRSTNKLSEIRSPARISNPVEQQSPVFPLYSKPTVPEALNGDEPVSDVSMGPSSGVAERLLQYGQNLTNSFGVYNSVPSPATNDLPDFVSRLLVVPQVAPSNDPLTTRSADSDCALTLSQVSPRKRPSFVPTPPTPPAKHPMSPLRTSSKRPGSPTSESLPRKKGKTDAPPAGNIGAGSSSSLASATTRQLRSRKQHTSNASASDSRSKRVDEEISKSKTRANAISASKVSSLRRSRPSHDETMTKSSSTSTSTSRSTRILCNSRPQDDDTKRPVSSVSSKGKGTVSSNSQISERPAFQIPPLDATKPVPFQSFADSRLLARKGGPSKGEAEAPSHSRSQREKKYHVPIPDFQAMHAAQEAKLALLKENIHPTVPHPIRLETDLRVKERQKFDEMIKEKEREQERLNEERRKEREEQEERELRELRKKTIPKAHSVPEWYKDAPRKQDSKFDSLGR